MKKNKNNNDRWQGYTPADCDCKYCVYYGGKKNGNVICLADTCVCSDEIRHERYEITQSQCFLDCRSDSSFFLSSPVR